MSQGDKPKDSEAKGAARLTGKRVAGGAASMKRFAWLLGVDDVLPPFKLHSVAWIEHHVEVAFDPGMSPTAKLGPAAGLQDKRDLVVFAIERVESTAKGFFTTTHLNAYFRGQDLPRLVAERIEKRAPERFGDKTIEDLADLLAEDPELGGPGLALPPDVNTLERPSNQLDTWGSEDAYGDFFAGGEIARGQLDSIDPTKLFQFVQHCDNECLQVQPHGVTPMVSLVDYPWEGRAKQAHGQTTLGKILKEKDKVVDDDPKTDESGEVSQHETDEMVTTDLSESDVVMGNPKKLRDILDHVTQTTTDKIIFFSNTCVPSVTGEDVESVVREYQEKSPVPLLYLTVTPRSMVNVFDSLLVERRLKAEEKAGPPDPRAINLIGFPDDRATEELGELLAPFGVRVNTLLLPELDVERVEVLPDAALNVILPNQLWQHMYDQIRFRSRIPFISPVAPYGLSRARTWVQEILTALNVEVPSTGTAFDKTWAQITSPFEAERDALFAKASTSRLGFVVREEEVYYLSDPGRTWSVPLLEMLEEAGFSFDLLLKVHDRASAKKAATHVQEALGDPRRHKIVGFNSLDMLLSRLEASDCQSVFSHHVFDWRLSQSGKTRFTLQHFEMGIAGYLRTLRRVTGLCETPFYQRYSRYLKRSPEGLRVVPEQTSSPSSDEDQVSS